jgi:hypothetical protein
VTLLGDSARFEGNGNTLFPVQETNIKLRKEVLSMDYTKWGKMHVNIYFEFFNPGEERELTVGFIDHFPDIDRKVPGVENFSVTLNDTVLEYSVIKLDDSQFTSLKENHYPQSINLQSVFDWDQSDDYIFYFKAKFKPGINQLQHIYRYHGYYTGTGQLELFYKLTTGTLWANSTIDDFEMYLNMGEDINFTIPSSFEKNIESNLWEMRGIGRMKSNGEKIDVYMKSGYLYYHRSKFKPDREIEIESDFCPLGDIFYLWKFENDFAKKSITSKSAEELMLFRNKCYALKGYKFNDKILYEHFNEFLWYIPDPNVPNSTEIFDEKELELVNYIIKLEKEKKKQTVPQD